jgi:hypothetical protein
MARCDAFDLQVLCRVTRKFKDFSGEILEDGGEVDGCFSADASLLARDCAKMTLYATTWKLKREKSVFRLRKIVVLIVTRLWLRLVLENL